SRFADHAANVTRGAHRPCVTPADHLAIVGKAAGTRDARGVQQRHRGAWVTGRARPAIADDRLRLCWWLVVAGRRVVDGVGLDSYRQRVDESHHSGGAVLESRLAATPGDRADSLRHRAGRAGDSAWPAGSAVGYAEQRNRRRVAATAGATGRIACCL